jgi:hypothetical protein
MITKNSAILADITVGVEVFGPYGAVTLRD